MPNAGVHLNVTESRETALSRKALRKRTPILFSLLIFAILLAVSIWAYATVNRFADAQVQTKLRHRTKEAGLVVQSQMQKYITYLYSAQGLFAASIKVDRDEWRAFVATFRLFDDYTGLVATSYNEFVKRLDKEAFINSVREDRTLSQEGYPDFNIFPEGDRDEYMVLNFVEPDSERKAVMGYDVLSEQSRKAAAEKARDLGSPVVSDRIQLLQDEKSHSSIVVFVPIYKNGVPVDSVSQKREALIGIVGLALRTQDLFSDLFENNKDLSQIRFRIYDGDGLPQNLSDEYVLFQHIPKRSSEHSSEKLTSFSITLNVGEQIWTIQADAGIEFYNEVVDERLPFLVLLFGSIFGMLISVIVYLLLSSRYRAEQSALKLFEKLKQSENVFQVMSDSSPLGIFLSDGDGWIQYSNKNYQKMAGLAPEHCLGLKWLEVVHSQDRERVLEEWQRAVKSKSMFQSHFRFLRKDGTVVWVHARSEPVFTKDKLIGFAGTVDDVSDRMLMDIALRESELYNRNLFDQSPIGLIICDTEYSIVDVNAVFAATIGYSHKECLNFKQDNFITQEFHHELDKHKECLRVSGTHGPIEVELIHKSGKTVPVRIWSVMIEKQDTPYIMSSIEDITDRKKVEDSLRKAQEDLIEAEKASTIAKLVSGAAHEIKNPLSILLQGAEYLNNKLGKGDHELAGMLSEMNKSVKKADAIIGSLLSVSILSEFVPNKENLNSIVDSVILLMKNDFDRKHIEVTSKLVSGLPLIALDRNKIVQVLANLFSNAADAMSDHGGALSVETKLVSSHSEDTSDSRGHQKNGQHKMVSLEITDSGSGIPDDILNQIFEPFFTTKRDKGGTGLGLPLVRSIVQMHGGSISLENRKDSHGVKATVLFPV